MKNKDIYVTADTHFFHKNMLRWYPNSRPWTSVDEMNEGLISNWNSTVGKNDVVYHLGDVALGPKGKIPDILKQLNGNIHLILGNHDKMLAGFDHTGMMYIKPMGQMLLDEGVLKSIQPYLEMYHNRKFVVMSHYGMRVWNKMHYGTYMLYGHSHGSLPGSGKSMDVGIDSSDMDSHQKPFLLDDVIEFLDSKDIVAEDHHKPMSE